MNTKSIIKKLGHIKWSLIECLDDGKKDPNHQIDEDLKYQVKRINDLVEQIKAKEISMFEKLKKELEEDFATALVYSKPWNDGAMLLNDVAIFDILEHVFEEKK